MIMAEANWSELPKKLLNLITERLDDDHDVISFLSVCSTWRSSPVSNHHHHHPRVPFQLPPHINAESISFECDVYQNSLLLIKPPQQQQNLHPWLIRTQKNFHGHTQLFHPLCPSNSSSSYCLPYELDFNKFSSVYLGTDFFLDIKKSYFKPSANPLVYSYENPLAEFLPLGRFKKVVAVTCQGEPLALGTLNHDGHPILFRCCEERWTPMPHMSMCFQDICVFKKRFCVVNKGGRTFAIGPDYSVQLVAEYLVNGGGDVKFLVESEGELLLVDIYHSHCVGFPGEDGFRLDVFRLDEKAKKWIKLTSLGDRVLFLGNGCSFFASASDLSVVKGNCVIFIGDAFLPFNSMLCGMCIFHMDQRQLYPLSDHPDYFNLLGPPPEWIFKSHKPVILVSINNISNYFKI